MSEDNTPRMIFAKSDPEALAHVSQASVAAIASNVTCQELPPASEDEGVPRDRGEWRDRKR